jgi:gp16 family phage-associated protein
MTKDEGKQVAERIFAKGYTITGWAKANKFNRRTVNDVLYGGLGGRTVSPVSDSIVAALVRDGFMNSCDAN